MGGPTQCSGKNQLTANFSWQTTGYKMAHTENATPKTPFQHHQVGNLVANRLNWELGWRHEQITPKFAHC